MQKHKHNRTRENATDEMIEKRIFHLMFFLLRNTNAVTTTVATTIPIITKIAIFTQSKEDDDVCVGIIVGDTTLDEPKLIVTKWALW